MKLPELSDIELIEIINGLQDLRNELKERQTKPSIITPLYFVKRIELIESLILKLGGGIDLE